MPTKIRATNNYTTIMSQSDQQPWWEKYQSNADKRQTEKDTPVSVSVEDLNFLKRFGSINISIAGIFALTKILKR